MSNVLQYTMNGVAELMLFLISTDSNLSVQYMYYMVFIFCMNHWGYDLTNNYGLCMKLLANFFYTSNMFICNDA